MVEIGGKPLLEYWLEILIELGIKEILINSHYLPEQIEDFISHSPYKSYITLIDEKVLLNTGGTLLHNRDFFGNDDLMLIHADNFSVCHYDEFVTVFEQRPKHTIGTMMTFTTNNPQSCGIVELDSQGVIQQFYEKVINPPSNLANGAVYLFESKIFDVLKEAQQKKLDKNETLDFSNDILPSLMGKLNTFYNDTCHIDIGTIENYYLACDYVDSTKNKLVK